MSTIRESFRLARWMSRVLRVFLKFRPLTTLSVVGMSVLSRITHLLAFFLPLKVILLAGSPGVPRYFQFFIDPENKADWVIWLSAAAVVSYLLMQLLDTLSTRLAEAGSTDIMERANEMALVGKERARAHSYYARLCQVVADSMFTAAMAVALVFINPVLLACLAGLMFVELLLTEVVLRFGDPLHPGRLQVFIRDNLREYLKFLSSINFLAGFFVILAPFLMGRPANILLAILAVVLLRRVFGALVSAIEESVDLYNTRIKIDPLIFRQHKLARPEAVTTRAVREVFSREQREQLVRKHLDPLLGNDGTCRVLWHDSPIKGAYTFQVVREAKGSPRALYQLQVFPPKVAHSLDSEEFLFSKVARASLYAPELITRFGVAAFECQVCDYARPLAPRQWKKIGPELLAHYWSFRPPRELVTAFKATRLTLASRLTDEVIERLSVAADSDEEQATFAELQRRLPEVRERLAALPLQIFNPDFSRSNVVLDGEGRVRVMTWTRWAIEPVGFEIPSGIAKKKIAGIVAKVNESRKGLKRPLTVDDIAFVRNCRKIERAIHRGQFKAALEVSVQLLLSLHKEEAEAHAGGLASGE